MSNQQISDRLVQAVVYLAVATAIGFGLGLLVAERVTSGPLRWLSRHRWIYHGNIKSFRCRRRWDADEHDVAVLYVVLVGAILLIERISHNFETAPLEIVGVAFSNVALANETD